MTLLRPWLLLWLVGCTTDLGIVAPVEADDPTVGASADTDVTVDGPQACDAHVAWTRPDADAVLVPVDAPLVVAFDRPLAPDTAWSLTMSGVDGVAVLAEDRQSATFTPDVPLSPEATYTLRGAVCADAVERSFTTRALPVTLEDIASRSWSMTPSDAEWVAPATAPVFAPLLDLPSFVLQIDDDSGTPHLVGRFAAESGRGLLPVPCAPVLDFGALDLSDSPHFTTSQDALEFRWLGLSVSLSAVHISGAFARGGAGIAELSLSARLDTRVIEALTGVQALCRQSVEFGEACEPCADGTSACLQTFVVQHAADETPRVDLYDDLLADLGLCAP